MMKNKESVITINPLDKWQTAIQLFEKKAENTIIALDKFEITLNDIAEEETYQLFQQNPNMPLSKVIACVFEGINENTLPNLLVKLTKKLLPRGTSCKPPLSQLKNMNWPKSE